MNPGPSPQIRVRVKCTKKIVRLIKNKKLLQDEACEWESPVPRRGNGTMRAKSFRDRLDPLLGKISYE